jgi:MraZ protein
MFRGRFDLKRDEKGRINLPNSFRAGLDNIRDGDAPKRYAKDQQLVITNGYSKGFKYLDVYTGSAWKTLENKISKLPSLKTEVQAFQRFYLSGGQELQPDKNNRILIPLSLRDYAELEDEVVLVGMNNKFEIWSKKMWKKFHDKVTENFDETLATIALLDDE